MPRPKAGDFILAAAVLLATAALWTALGAFSGGYESRTAVIICGDTEPVRIELGALDAPAELDPFGDGTVLLFASSDGIRFTHSNCPDKTCVRTGIISRPGQTAACLPRRVLIYIESGAGGVDTVAE